MCKIFKKRTQRLGKTRWFFEGCDENSELLYEEIKSGEKENVVFVFEGEYLGGEIKQDISFPEEIILSLC